MAMAASASIGGVSGVPETFVVDKAGLIRYKHIGPVDAAAIQTKILPLVRELDGDRTGPV